MKGFGIINKLCRCSLLTAILVGAAMTSHAITDETFSGCKNNTIQYYVPSGNFVRLDVIDYRGRTARIAILLEMPLWSRLRSGFRKKVLFT